MTKHALYSLLIIIISFSCLLSTPHSLANELQVWQQSGQSIGNYGAGAGAIANDNTTSFYNPAGVTRIRRQDGSLSIISRIQHIKYNGQIINSNKINSSHIAQGGGFNALPTILYAAPISKKWGFGFSVTTPFENEVNYGNNVPTRFFVMYNKIRTTDISPAFAYRVFDSLSVGLGGNVQFFDLKYERADSSLPSNTENISKNHIDDWSFGWNGGILWEPTEKTRIGLTYRSKITHKPSGKSKLTSNDQLKKSRAHMRISLPASAALNTYQELTSNLAWLATIHYTAWNQTNAVTLNNIATQSGSEDIILQRKLNNTWRFILGINYKVNSKFILRSGIGYSQSPIRKTSQTFIFPETDKYILSCGFGYNLSDKLILNMGYTHVFGKRRSLHYKEQYAGEPMTIIGKLDSTTDLFGLQLSWFMT